MGCLRFIWTLIGIPCWLALLAGGAYGGFTLGASGGNEVLGVVFALLGMMLGQFLTGTIFGWWKPPGSDRPG